MGKSKTATILLSRQHLRPSLKDEWVRKLILAVKHVKGEGWILNSSAGSANWEIVTASAVINDVPLKLFLSLMGLEDFEVTRQIVSYNFELSNESAKFNAVLPIEKASNKEKIWQYRDRTVLESSDFIIPVSVRANGTMSALLRLAKESGKNVIDSFQTEYDFHSPKLSYSIEENRISDRIKEIGQKFIIHWTRATNGCWPNEKKIDFYREVLNSSEYPRTAFKMLKRILNEKLIIGSAKKMPGKTPTVSFSGLAPADVIKLMKWRARYCQMTFEPYGYGIEREVAESLGIRKVQYYDPKSRKNASAVPNWLTQSIGKITDWRNEEEFRFNGNLDLKRIPADKLIAICFHKVEAIELEKETGIETVWFYD